jgi:hypothetical protein
VTDGSKLPVPLTVDVHLEVWFTSTDDGKHDTVTDVIVALEPPPPPALPLFTPPPPLLLLAPPPQLIKSKPRRRTATGYDLLLEAI